MTNDNATTILTMLDSLLFLTKDLSLNHADNEVIYRNIVSIRKTILRNSFITQ